MRIALVTETTFPAPDGSSVTIKAVADRLIDTGHEVRIVAPGPGLASYRRSVVTRVATASRPGRQVRDALEEFAPDLVHVTSPGLAPRSIGRKALKHARRAGLRTLVVQQAPVPELAWELWRTSVAERADRILVTSPWLGAHLGSLGVTTTTWLPGVDTAAFTPAVRDPWLHRSWSRGGSTQPLTVVGYVGGLRRHHGVRRLAELADVPGVRLVVVGDGPQRAWLADRVPQARFAGVLSGGDLATAVASLDVLVHPGEQETCCHALREAAASGVPALAPRAGGAASVVIHAETGLLHDPARPAGLAESLSDLLGDPATPAGLRRTEMGRRAREIALTRGWHDAVDELVTEHYRAAIGVRAA